MTVQRLADAGAILAAGSVVQRAEFVPGGLGQRLRIVSEPARADPLGYIVLAPAFAEEMNKCRRLCARFARQAAAQGWRVVQTDLSGCGDSSGEFRDARWEAWVEDLRTDLAQAMPDRPTWLWCVRGGALLATEVLAGHPQVDLLLWQPALSGAQHLQQFLRLHAGARIVGQVRDTDQRTPMQRLRAGESVEVGGYELDPSLAEGMESAVLRLSGGDRRRVVAVEVSADAALQPSMPLQRWLDQCRTAGTPVQWQVVSGPQFWQTQEIEDNEFVLAASLGLLCAAESAHA